MIIKKNTTSLILTLSFLLLLPLVQKQWFNLYLFNINNISFYSILYYLSGTICPFLICLNSLNNFTYYKFNKNKIHNRIIIKGKALFFLVAINLIIFSYLIVYYLFINYDLISKIFLEGIKVQHPDFFQLSLLIPFISILLILKKFRLFFKKLMLVNFILISFFIWYLQINNFKIDDHFYFYGYFGFNEIDLINVYILFAIEITYFIWSFLSYKTNLSDWMVHLPQKADLITFLNILIFYIFLIFYYSLIA